MSSLRADGKPGLRGGEGRQKAARKKIGSTPPVRLRTRLPPAQRKERAGKKPAHLDGRERAVVPLEGISVHVDGAALLNDVGAHL